MENIKKLLKSHNDPYDYYTYKIPENNLSVFVIHDKDATMSYASMNIKVGSMNDTVEGIAHFLEHMLFNGTKSYPDENYFNDYISKFGGMRNAFTAHDRTYYYYTINSEKLLESLKIFGEFFSDPMLNVDTIDREKEAVNAEHMMNINNDDWRLEAIASESFSDNHPLKKFSTGCSETLDIPDISKEVRNFYEKYYSSEIMTLFVVTNDISELKQCIDDVFKKVPVRPVVKNNYPEKIIKSSSMIKVLPINDAQNLRLIWEIPSFRKNILFSPNLFLCHLIGDESKNSLHSILVKKGYISNLLTSTEYNVNDTCLLVLDIKLSPLGSQNYKDILVIVFDYIILLKSKVNTPHMKMLYEDQLKLTKYMYKYIGKQNHDDLCSSFGEMITCYDINYDYLPSLKLLKVVDYDEYVKDNLHKVLSEYITLNNVIIIHSSKEYENIDLKTEKYYGTRYSLENIIKTDKRTELVTELIGKNEYISVDDILDIKEYKNPKIIRDDCVKIFYYPINKYNTPDVYIRGIIHVPLALKNKLCHTLIKVYIRSILSDINDEIYTIIVAGYMFNIFYDEGKIYVNVCGNRGKIEKVIEFLITSLINGLLVSTDNFTRSKYVIKMRNKNEKFDPLFKKIDSNVNKQICTKFYNDEDILSVIDDITYDKTMISLHKLLKLSSVELIISGNITKDTALNIGKMFDVFIKNDEYKIDHVMDNIYTCPIHDRSLYSFNSNNPDEQNNAMKYMVFIDKSLYGVTENWNRNICLSKILDNMMSSDYFDELRTKEKYGYIVSSSISDYCNTKFVTKYFTFLVQSPHKDTNNITKRTSIFIKSYLEKLNSLSDEKFNNVVESCIALLLQPYVSIENEMSSIELQIDRGLYSCDLVDILHETYKSLNKEDLIRFYTDKFINGKHVVICIDKN
jgi:insulysin